MNQTFRTTQRLVVSALLLTAVAIAQAGANNTDNAESTEHHSKLSKVAFWRHHNDANKNAKQDAAKPATSEHAQPKAAQVKRCGQTVSVQQDAGETGFCETASQQDRPETEHHQDRRAFSKEDHGEGSVSAAQEIATGIDDAEYAGLPEGFVKAVVFRSDRKQRAKEVPCMSRCIEPSYPRALRTVDNCRNISISPKFQSALDFLCIRQKRA